MHLANPCREIWIASHNKLTKVKNYDDLLSFDQDSTDATNILPSHFLPNRPFSVTSSVGSTKFDWLRKNIKPIKYHVVFAFDVITLHNKYEKILIY